MRPSFLAPLHVLEIDLTITSAGYVSTGFWLGLTVGRIVLLKLNAWVGERRIVSAYLLVAAALEVSHYVLSDKCTS